VQSGLKLALREEGALDGILAVRRDLLEAQVDTQGIFVHEEELSDEGEIVAGSRAEVDG
jgi:hypothetical protein